MAMAWSCGMVRVRSSLLWIQLLAVQGALAAPRLRVMSVTPAVNSARASLEAPTEVMLSGRQAITVTFNRAFIALGSDYGTGPLPTSLTPIELEPSVPGHMRWVTTSVIRFDPSDDWPAELNLKLSLRAGVTAYDGASLNLTLQHEWRFRTPALRMHIQSVDSKRAKKLTAGRWIPGTLPEVPPDGIVQLRFTSDVELEFLQQHLQLHEAGHKHREDDAGVSFKLSECKSGPSQRRVCLTPSDTLEAERKYELVLPSGSRFHKHGGLTHKEMAVRLQGLHGFSFPLEGKQPEKDTWFRPRYRRMRLWLRHGLQEGTDMVSLSRQFELTPAMQFTLTHPEPAVLQLEAEFQPDTEYELTIAASGEIRDGFGLPLQASKGFFRTAALEHFFLEPGASDYFVQDAMFSPGGAREEGVLDTWPILARGRKLCEGQEGSVKLDCRGGKPQHIELVPVREEDIPKALASIRNERAVFVQSSDTVRLEAPLHDEATELHMPLVQSMKPSGLVLHTRWTSNRYNPKVSSLLGTPSLVAVFVATSDNMLTVWVLQAKDNAVVADATVTAFGFSCWDKCQPTDVTALAVSVTDQNGVAHLRVGESKEQLAVAVVKQGEPLLLHTDVPHTSQPPPDFFKGQLVADRGVYKPLDVVMLKGYVRLQTGEQLTNPSSMSMHSLTVQWTSGGQKVMVPVSLHSEYGSFNANLTVPADAKFGNHFIELEQVNPPQYEFPRTISTVRVTVADPRPPTVSLDVKAREPFLPPDGDLPLTITTSTLSGVRMANASVKLTWRLQHRTNNEWWKEADEEDEDSKKEQTGMEKFSTGDNGSAEIFWRLPQSLSTRARAGDSVQMSFEWVGPTRELLSQHLTVPVARSAWKLELSVPEPRDALPGQPLSVTATLRRRVDLQGTARLVPDVPLSISLYHISDDQADTVAQVMDSGPELLPQRSAKLHRCQTEEGERAKGTLFCELELPAMGRYLVTACTGQDNSVQQLCSVVPAGRTAAEWKKRPLADFLQQAISKVIPDRQMYHVGDVPRLEFHNPLPGLRAFVKWGNRLSFRSIVTPRLSAGPTKVDLQPLSQECDGGCHVWMLLCAPSNSTRELLVPTSPLFHLQGPQSAMHMLSLDVVPKESQELTVVLKPDRAVQVPGSQAGFTVSLRHADGSPADGEVSVFAVDQAFLDLQPHAPVNLSQTLQLDTRGAQLDHTFSHKNLVSAHGLKFSKDALMKLLAADPWLLDSGTEWPVRPTQGSLEQLSLEYMLRDNTFDLTEMPWGGAGFLGGNLLRARGAPLFMAKSAAPVAEMALMEESAAAPAMADADASDATDMSSRASAGGNGGGRQAAKALPVRNNFIVTPLFLPALQVHGGSAHVEWTLPDNIGSFELRAYAVSKNHQFGGGSTAQQIVRRPVSMTPSVPRIVRVGDTFKGGVILTAAPDQTAPHTLHVKTRMHGAAVSLATEAAWDRVRVGAGQTVEVGFGMHATSLGNVTLVVSVSDASGDLLDALRIELVVLGVQPEVQVATSFAVTASPPPALPWYEGLVLPASAKGSGHLSVLAGAGREPAVQNLAGALLREWEVDSTQDHSANSALCTVATAAMLNVYADASASKHYHNAEQQLVPAAQELAKLTNEKGLHYSAASLASTTDQCDLLLNAFALYILRRLRLANIQMPSALVPLEATWRNALEYGLQEYANRMLQQKPHRFEDFDVLAASRLALGSHWQPRNFASRRQNQFEKLQSALSTERLLEAVDSLSIFSKASLGLLLMLPGEPGQDKSAALLKASLTEMPGETRSILEYLTSSLRITARTAYVAQSPGSQHAASISANSMALSALAMAMHLTAENHKHFTAGMDKLANYVAQGADSRAAVGSASLLHMAFGLVDYDLASGNTNADLEFVALAGSEQLLTVRVDPAADKSPSLFETPWDKLPRPPPPLLFKAEGVGEVSVAVTLRFVPPVQMGHSAPVYHGIDVQKIVQLYDAMLGSPHGPPLDAIPLGSIVTVTLQVTTTDDLRGVSIEDWLPAGLEALDPNLHSARMSTKEPIAGCLWYFCPVFYRETKKDRVTFYSSWLYAGTHTLTYQAVAATLGSFVLPPGRATVTLEPELMGMSSGGQFHVLSSDEQPLTRSSLGLPVLKQCPHDCMGRGECNTTSGKCNCNPGSSGIDCSSEAHLPVMQPFVGSSGQIFEEALKLVAGGTKEVELLVELVAQSVQKPLLPTWMFASSTDFLAAGDDGAGRQLDGLDISTKTGNQSDIADVRLTLPTPLHLQVLPSKRRVVLVPPQEVPRAVTANVTVSASADGRLFASRRLVVQLYPHCIPGSSRACDCDQSAAGEERCSAAGTYGMCACSDQSQNAPSSGQVGKSMAKVQEAQADDRGFPWAVYILMGLCVLIAWTCYQVGWRRIYCRFTQFEEGGPLFGRAEGRQTELASRGDGTSLLRSGSPAVDADYWNVADVGE